ncbi:lytic transglycosylase [Thiosulfatimonas sediminis]|uniref:Lytic transglycosylase n=1 Tax=Thiosulfatimonas sediminis TaxID=2675054 RepID=A0A6F8PUQ0_9GAMM|nr:transglycosylase SLT domain-containing protein [Thiosulfatimonas sediminis]BBP45744.1 lytic transglycosylase [Thiosulfatimonas sediminis]
MSAQAQPLSIEQKAYIDAYEAIKRNDRAAIASYKQQLQNYTLYPYVLYHDYRVNIDSTPPRVIEFFLNRYQDLYLSDKLRTHWLKHLAATKQWPEYLLHYTPQNSQSLQCNFYHASIAFGTDAQKEKAISAAQQLWQSLIEIPEACVSVETALRNQKKFTAQMVWNRITLLIQKKQFSRAQDASKDLSNADKKVVNAWINIVRNPNLTSKEITTISGFARKEAFIQAVPYLASQNPQLAQSALAEFAEPYGLNQSQRIDIQRKIALRSAYRYQEEAKALLENVNTQGNGSEETIRWQAQIALRNSRWIDLLDTIELMSKEEQDSNQWRYWRARALEARGDQKTAHTLYQTLAQKRNYYGFLAADRIRLPYQFNPEKNTQLDQTALIKKYPALQRIAELIAVDWVKTAQVEWHYFLPNVAPDELISIATLAKQWEQYPHAIRSLALAKEWDHINLRFPTPHKEPVMENAKKNDIEAAWIYGIIRRESAFNEDIRSSAGAVGLMQIMPKTAKYIGKRIGNDKTSIYALTEAKNNIQLGSAYMRYLSDKYNDNKVLATAAYNAGPHRVAQWTQNLLKLDADQWVDSIPFTETRNYVKAVLEYTTVFNSLLHGQYARLSDQMPAIGSDNKLAEK